MVIERDPSWNVHCRYIEERKMYYLEMLTYNQISLEENRIKILENMSPCFHWVPVSNHNQNIEKRFFYVLTAFWNGNSTKTRWCVFKEYNMVFFLVFVKALWDALLDVGHAAMLNPKMTLRTECVLDQFLKLNKTLPYYYF